MTTWTLLIVLWLPHSGGPVAVPGFASEAACEAAAERIEFEWKAGSTILFPRRSYYWCVEVR